MPKIINEPYPHIDLSISKRLIKEFGLQDIVINSYKIRHPKYFQMLINFDDDEVLNFPFNFPDSNEKPTAEYLNEFLKQYHKLVDVLEDKHHDNLLFLSYIYFTEKNAKASLLSQHDRLRQKGKVLLNFIKVYIPILNEHNISATLIEGYDLEPGEANDYILAYLEVASKLPEAEFLNEPSDRYSGINFKKIDEALWLELTRRIQKDINVSIPIDEYIKDGEPRTKFLTVSSDIKIKLQPINKSEGKSFAINDTYLQKQLLGSMIKDLFTKQKEHRTDFYYALLKHDFIISTNFNELTSSTGAYNRSSQRYYLLEKLFHALNAYFDLYHLFAEGSPEFKERKRCDFIFQYFLLMGLINNTGTKQKRDKNSTQITEAIEDFDRKREENLNYAKDTLKLNFQNNLRSEKYKFGSDCQRIGYF